MASNWIGKKPLSHALSIVTGSNQGIGLAASSVLGAMQSAVLMGGRNTAKLQEAKDQVVIPFVKEHQQTTDHIHAASLDLASFESVKNFSTQCSKLEEGKVRPMHLLIHNAGLMLKNRIETGDGLESSLQVNYLSPTLLTLSYLRSIYESHERGDLDVSALELRIIHVNTGLHAPVQLKLDDLQSSKSYEGFRAYSHAKLAQVVFSKFLQLTYDEAVTTTEDKSLQFLAELKNAGLQLRSVCLDPGWVRTNLVRTENGFSESDIKKLMGGAKKTPDEGAATIVAIATEDALEGGAFWFNGKPGGKQTPLASDKKVQADLWSATKSLIEWE